MKSGLIMMREILFRGKTEEGKWVYGSPLFQEDRVLIRFWDSKTLEWQEYLVIPETIGQYTGMTDENGTKIFEGDIMSTKTTVTKVKKLKGYYGYDDEGYPKKIPNYSGFGEYPYPCQVNCYAKVARGLRGGYYLYGTDLEVDAIRNNVVGNIYDNPELLKDITGRV